MPPTRVEPAQQLRSIAQRYTTALGSVGPIACWLPNGGARPTKAAIPHADSVIRFDVGKPQSAESAVEHPGRRDEELSRLEAVLLLAREPLNSRKLAQFANLTDGTRARTLVRRLNERYDAAGRSFRVEQVAGGYQLRSRLAFAPWLRKLAHLPGESRLSAPALETLAVIAYRQPVPRADIEAIRGVSCGEILRQLLERDLVRVGGRSEEMGRPFLYATTRRFLDLFGLMHLDDLPRGELLRHAPLPAAGPSVTILAESQRDLDGRPAAGVDDGTEALDEPWPAPDTSSENLDGGESE